MCGLFYGLILRIIQHVYTYVTGFLYDRVLQAFSFNPILLKQLLLPYHFIAMPCLRDIIVGSHPTRPHKCRCIYYTHTCTHAHGVTKITTLGEAIHYRTGIQTKSPPIHDSARELQTPTQAIVTSQKHPWFDFSYGPSVARNKPMDSIQNWIQYLGAIVIITK